jgi:predicted amidohydrolase YtcJ
MNSAVLRRCRIDRNTHVDGGFIGRDDGDEPDGRVFDAACDLLTGPDGVRIRDHGPNFHLPIDAAEVADLLDAAQDEFLSVGIMAVGTRKSHLARWRSTFALDTTDDCGCGSRWS